jgi:hypothetical protein
MHFTEKQQDNHYNTMLGYLSNDFFALRIEHIVAVVAPDPKLS